MNNGCWNGYTIQNALVIMHDCRPKILCAFFMTKEYRKYNWNRHEWESRRTEAHISICSTVPPHIDRLWTPGARADDW